jgi:hypothetical protein
VALSAWLAAPTAAVAGLAALGLVLPASRRPGTVGVALTALACAAGEALDHGAAPATAPLWGAGLLVAGSLAERALTLPADGEVEVAALVGWLAGLGALTGAGLAAAAVVLLAAGTNVAGPVAGVAAGTLLAVVPATLAWHLSGPTRAR